MKLLSFISLISLMIPLITKNAATTTRALYRCSQRPKPDHPIAKKQGEAIVQKGQDQLMEDNYQKVKMDGLHDRDITGTDQFQTEILQHNKFDLLHPKIVPKTASLSTTMGLEHGSQLTEISLGQIQVKKQNQVFLSQVDPQNIPDYYQIVFDRQKEMTVVGKQLQNSPEQQSPSTMGISSRKAFEEQSQEQISSQVMGVRADPFKNSRVAWKVLYAAVALSYLLSYPLVATYAEQDQCLDSIREVEAERMGQIAKIKRAALANAIIENKQVSLR